MRVPNETGIRNLCAVAVHLRQTMPINAATKYAIRTVLREAINKSNSNYKGNVNRRNCRFLSLAAEQRLASDPTDALVADHAKPVAGCLREFDRMQPLSVDSALAAVRGYAIMVLITPEEDARLNAAGLVKRMPTDWDSQDILARYKQVGIEVRPNPAFVSDALVIPELPEPLDELDS